MIRNSIRFALGCGIMICVLFILARYFESNPFIDINHLFADLFIFALFIYFACKDFKQFRNEGILHFWQGMTIGFVTYALAAVIFLVFLAVHFNVDETLLADYKVDALSFLEKRSAEYIEQFGQNQYEEQKVAIEETKVQSLILQATLKKLLAGLFVTPVISIILRKKPK